MVSFVVQTSDLDTVTKIDLRRNCRSRDMVSFNVSDLLANNMPILIHLSVSLQITFKRVPELCLYWVENFMRSTCAFHHMLGSIWSSTEIWSRTETISARSFWTQNGLYEYREFRKPRYHCISKT